MERPPFHKSLSENIIRSSSHESAAEAEALGQKMTVEADLEVGIFTLLPSNVMGTTMLIVQDEVGLFSTSVPSRRPNITPLYTIPENDKSLESSDEEGTPLMLRIN